MPETLVTKYRPSKLADIMGQPEVVAALQLFAADPKPQAFLFHGGTGVGKTGTAYALAHELGVKVEEEELGGLHEIASGDQTGETVRAKMASLRLRPAFGSGWRVLIVNEADSMTAAAGVIWLDALEHLPPRTVVVFTTNNPAKLPERFRHRCRCFSFESDSAKLAPAIRKLCQRVWKKEVGKGDCPALKTLGMPVLGSTESMNASFRLALQQLETFVAEARAGTLVNGRVAKVEAQMLLDGRVDRSLEKLQTACDHCGHEQLVAYATTEHECEKCRKRFSIDW